tara:strand:- start:1665 stop:2336 length:672 start_codon:yes stop_codon:yes gene_type:complete
MLENKILIIDFDSTFIKVETLDELAKLVLKNDSNRDAKISKIKEITNLAMSGEIDFQTALRKRLEVLSLHRTDIIKVTQLLSNLISDSFVKNKEFIQFNSDKIWIVSGGFKDIIDPIIKEYDIPPNRILANQFKYNDDKVIGCYENNDLFKDRGKILAIEKQKINGLKIMIGDGYTDYEVFENGTANFFICFTENIKRDKVINMAQYHAESFDSIISIIKNLE